jgi:hypothetical protein
MVYKKGTKDKGMGKKNDSKSHNSYPGTAPTGHFVNNKKGSSKSYNDYPIVSPTVFLEGKGERNLKRAEGDEKRYWLRG